MTPKGLITNIENVSDGTYTVESIFIFQEQPELFPAFLHIAYLNNVKVVFRNENEVFEPQNKEAVDSVKVASWVTYLSMNSKYAKHYADYLTKELKRNSMV